MTTKREAVLQALAARLGDPGGRIAVLRNDVLPARIPEPGLVILRDGDLGEPEVTLSPLCYHWEHRAEVEMFVRGSAGREAAFDALAQAIGAALASDRTLGGQCDWVEADGLVSVDLPADGATPIRAALLTIVLHYTSDDLLA